MKYLRESSEEEMLFEFLKGELNSDRFSADLADAMAKVGTDAETLLDPNLSNAGHNRLRLEVMGVFRGYSRNEELFERFPEGIRWAWYETEPEDQKHIFYIRYDYWDILSGGTSLPLDAVPYIRSGKVLFDTPNEQYLNAEAFLRNGGKFPPVILLTGGDGRYIIMEGHLRMTAYAMAPETFPGNRVIVGHTTPEALDYWNVGEENP